MTFADELRQQNSIRKSKITIQNVIAAIKKECTRHRSERKIDGYFCEIGSSDGNPQSGIEALPPRYTNTDVNLSKGGAPSAFRCSGTRENERRGRYNWDYYGATKFFYSPNEIEVEGFEYNIDRELKELGFSNFFVTLLPVENEVAILSKGFLGNKIRYEITGERGYLIRIRVSW